MDIVEDIFFLIVCFHLLQVIVLSFKRINKIQKGKLKDYVYYKTKLFPSNTNEGSDEIIDSLSNVRTIPLSEEIFWEFASNALSNPIHNNHNNHFVLPLS